MSGIIRSDLKNLSVWFFLFSPWLHQIVGSMKGAGLLTVANLTARNEKKHGELEESKLRLVQHCQTTFTSLKISFIPFMAVILDYSVYKILQQFFQNFESPAVNSKTLIIIQQGEIFAPKWE